MDPLRTSAEENLQSFVELLSLSRHSSYTTGDVPAFCKEACLALQKVLQVQHASIWGCSDGLGELCDFRLIACDPLSSTAQTSPGLMAMWQKASLGNSFFLR